MKTRIGLVSAVALIAVSRVFAAGLGEIELRSWLGQPLNARVALLGEQTWDPQSVTIQLASVRAYQQAGIEFPSILHGIQFSVSDNELLITTRQRVNEPILELLLVVETPSGNVQRQFTVLLDLPPTQNETPVVATSSSAAPQIIVAPPSQPIATESPAETISEPSAQVVATASASQYGPVQRNESLWRIARQLQTQIGLDQQTIMANLYAHNPSAFLSGDPNRLMEGSTLQLPSQWSTESRLPTAKTLATAVAVVPVSATTVVAKTAEPVAALPTQLLSEQNRQLRSEIAQLTERLSELETRLANASPATTPSPSPDVIAASQTVVNATANVTPQVMAEPPVAVELPVLPTPPQAQRVAPKPAATTATVITRRRESNNGWWWFSGSVLVASVVLWLWLARRDRGDKKPLLDERVWQERKRSAREAHHAERNIPTPNDWNSHDHANEAPHAAETMEIKLQYVRSAVDTFMLFQRYNEALAFLRREIFEAGHDSPLGHRLDGLYRETKEHLKSLGIEDSVPTGEAKLEIASQRSTLDDKHIVTPLRKARPPSRRDLL